MFKREISSYNHLEEVDSMIVYAPLWRTMDAKGVTTYTLVHRFHFSRGTLHSLKHNKNISTATLNDLCQMLDCRVEDILEFVPDQQGSPM